MVKIAKKLTDLVGNTPLLELSAFGKYHALNARVIGKLEYFNPLGSVKDRVALSMVEDAERNGLLLSLALGHPNSKIEQLGEASLLRGSEDCLRYYLP